MYGDFAISDYNKEWASRKLWHHFQNSNLLINDRDDDIQEYYKLFNGQTIGKKLYQQIFNGEDGNNFKISDYKNCPLIYPLLNTLQEKIIEIPHSIEISAQDNFSKDERVKMRESILARERVMDIINSVKKQLGEPMVGFESKLSDTENPEEEITQIRNELSDNYSLSMAEKLGGLKVGLEMATEMATNHYLSHLEVKKLYGYELASSIIGTNTAALRFYTDINNGTPKVRIVKSSRLRVNSFNRKDGKDIDSISDEYTCTFKEYMDEVGYKIPAQDNLQLFRWHSDYKNDPITVDNLYTDTNYDKKVKIGYAEFIVLEQSESGKYIQKTKCIYYVGGQGVESGSVPPEKILLIQDLQDQQLEGENLKYSQTSYIICKAIDRGITAWQMLRTEYERLNSLYFEWINIFRAFVPNGGVFAYEAFLELAKKVVSVNDTETAGTHATRVPKMTLELIKRYSDSGIALVTAFKGDEGVEPNVRVSLPSLQNGALDDLIRLSSLIYQQYQNMLRGIGYNENMLGAIPKARTTAKSINSANAYSSYTTNFLDEIYKDVILRLSHKLVYYTSLVATEFNDKLEPKNYRAKVLKNIIGDTATASLSIRKYNIDLDLISVNIEIESTEDDFVFLYNTASMYLQIGKINPEDIIYLKSIENYKYASLYLLAAIKRKERKDIDMQISVMQQQQAAQAQAQQEALAIQAQNKNQEAEIEARLVQLENQGKYQGQMQVAEQKDENKKGQMILEKQIENTDQNKY